MEACGVVRIASVPIRTATCGFGGPGVIAHWRDVDGGENHDTLPYDAHVFANFVEICVTPWIGPCDETIKRTHRQAARWRSGAG